MVIGMGTWIKLGAALAVVLVIYFGYTFVVNLQEDNVRLSKENATLALANKSLKKEREQIKTDLKIVEQQRMILNQELTESREKTQKVVRLFSDHDFQKLIDAKPGLVIKRMNKGTKKIFLDIEKATSNE